jgi:hypothetical protein
MVRKKSIGAKTQTLKRHVNADANGREITAGDLVQEQEAGYVGRAITVDGGVLLYHPLKGQKIGPKTAYACCDECIVLIDVVRPAAATSTHSRSLRTRLPIREAAKELCVDYRHLLRLSRDQKIRSYRRGNRYEFYLNELREDLDRAEQYSFPPPAPAIQPSHLRTTSQSSLASDM